MNNRKPEISVPFYENLAQAKLNHDQEILAKDKAASEANFASYRDISRKLAEDPRFVNTFN